MMGLAQMQQPGAVQVSRSERYRRKPWAQLPEMELNWQSFGLEHSPLDWRPGVNPFCPLPHLLVGMNRLHAALEQQGLAMLTAEVGMGKTMLLRQLRHDSHVRVAWLEGRSGTSVGNLLKCIAHHMRLPLPSMQESLEEQVEAIAGGLREVQGEPCLMVVDEAHQLPVSTLAALFHVLGHQPLQRRPLRVLLAGEPVLYKRSQSLLSESHQGAYQWQLAPWGAHDIQQYLIWRLQQSGWQVDQTVIATEWCETMSKASGGIPAKVDHAAELELLTQLHQHRMTQEALSKPKWWQRWGAQLRQWPFSAFVATVLTSVCASSLLGQQWGAWHATAPAVAVSSSQPVVMPAKVTEPAPVASAEEAAIQSAPVASVAASAVSVVPMLWDHGFALQLASSVDLSRLRQQKQVWARRGVASQLMQTLRGDRIWYVLVQGPFVDLSQAKVAQGQLSQISGAPSAWIRPLDRVKAGA